MPVIDMMRVLFDKGVRPESFAEMLLELHSKKHIDDYLRREFAMVHFASQKGCLDVNGFH
jgi:rRNA pseudouridine-1189 N-methylase Emg1 (Nep1/Mra1 family)